MAAFPGLIHLDESSWEVETPDPATRHQDTYRRVLLGQVADPLFPAHPSPAEVPEGELARLAMIDPGAKDRDAGHPVPPIWRWLGLVILAAFALGLVFGETLQGEKSGTNQMDLRE